MHITHTDPGEHSETSEPQRAQRKINKLFVEHEPQIAHNRKQLSICTASKSTFSVETGQTVFICWLPWASVSLSFLTTFLDFFFLLLHFRKWEACEWSGLKFVCVPDGCFTYLNMQINSFLSYSEGLHLKKTTIRFVIIRDWALNQSHLHHHQHEQHMITLWAKFY